MTVEGRDERGRWAARGAAALCSGIAAFQLALVGGAPWGRAAWGGQQAELPDVLRVASGGSALLWTGAAVALLAFSGDLADGRYRGAVGLRRVTWAVAGVSGVGTVMNLVSRSGLERGIWAPIALSTAVLAAVAARTIAAGARTAIARPSAL